MKPAHISIPYEVVDPEAQTAKFNATLMARYQKAFFLGVIDQPNLHDDGTLEVQVQKPRRLKPDEVIAITQAGGTVTNWSCFASVAAAGTCYYLGEGGEAMTWAEWLAKQYPHIAPQTIGDRCYFGIHPGGHLPDSNELLALQQSGVTLLTADEYKAATQTESAPV